MTDSAPVADEHKLDVRHAGGETVGIDHREGATGNPVIVRLMLRSNFHHAYQGRVIVRHASELRIYRTS